MAYSVRSIFYFAVWCGLSFFLVRWSEKLRKDKFDSKTRSRIKALSAGGLILYAFTVSFASIDWVMSLEPSWYSTVYGMVYFVSQAMTAFGFVLFLLPRVSKNVSTKALNDLGNILLAFIMFWAYISFLQYLIIWSGNIPEEAIWFNHRRHGGWQYLITLIALVQFAGPFLFLLFKDLKKNVVLLGYLGLGVLLIRVVDVFWFIMPAFHPEGWFIRLSDGVLFLLIGCLWCLSFKWSWQRGGGSAHA
jgi:hypothetical protein